jgi:hypothetical protein
VAKYVAMESDFVRNNLRLHLYLFSPEKIPFYYRLILFAYLALRGKKHIISHMIRKYEISDHSDRAKIFFFVKRPSRKEPSKKVETLATVSEILPT